MALESKQSNLSETAKEVYPHLRRTYAELRRDLREEVGEAYEELEGYEGGENLVKLANKIIRGEAEEGEKIDFKIYLAEAKSQILSDEGLADRGKMIRRNYVDKLERAVLGG